MPLSRLVSPELPGAVRIPSRDVAESYPEKGRDGRAVKEERNEQRPWSRFLLKTALSPTHGAPRPDAYTYHVGMPSEPTIHFDLSSVPIRATGAVQAEVDGELILLSPADFSYFGAQGTGGVVWAMIDGSRTVGDVIGELESRYDAPAAVIREETTSFLDALRAAGLIEFDKGA